MKRKLKLLYCIGRESDYIEFKASLASLNSMYDKSEYELMVYKQKFIQIEDRIHEYIDNLKVLPTITTSHYDKIYAINHCDFDYFLFLDCDTLIVDKLDSLFELLDQFELGISYAPMGIKTKITGVPDSFLEMNTGTILINRTLSIDKFLENWEEAYKDHYWSNKHTEVGPDSDQFTFRKCLYESNVRFYVYDHSYNCGYNTNANYIFGKIKILHGRYIEKEELGKLLEHNNIHHKKFRHWKKKITHGNKR